MALNQLTDKEIQAHIRKGKAKLLSDGGNLYLRLRGESQSWLFRFKVPQAAAWANAELRGKPIEIGLKAYPARSLSDARRVAEELRSDLANDIDPRERFRVGDDDGETFQKWAKAYIGKEEGGWRNPKHRQQWRNTLRDYVYSELGKRPVADITRNHVKAALQPLWDDEKFETFSRVRMRIETVLDYAFYELDIDRANPARWKGNLQNSFGKLGKRQKVKSHAAAPWREVPAIMAKLRAKPEVVSALAMRFSILTAARSGEVRGLEWREIDEAERVWRLPEARSKNGKEHHVPLNAEAIEILENMKALGLEGKRVFAGPTGGMISDVAVSKQLKAAYPGITAHGTARSSFRDWVADATNYPGEVAEAALNHTNPNAIEAAYLRTTYFEKRKMMMDDWGNFLAGINNVVSMREVI